MEPIELSALLKKQLSGSIKHVEFVRLRELLYSLDEQIIEQCLFDVWETYTPTDKRNVMSFEKVKENLIKIIQPQIKIWDEGKKNVTKRTNTIFLKYMQRVAAIVLLPLMLSFGVYYITRKATIDELAANQYSIETSNGERSRLVLPDGTRVLVSANSTFTYPATFGKKSREVNLEGEAFFDVTHNADLPFVVKSKEISVSVLGTKFNIYAYPEESYFEASLVKGSIQVTVNDDKTKRMILVPNEKVIYNYASQTFNKLKTDLRTETAWTRGDLYFQSESLATILPKLERFYGVRFTMEGKIPVEFLTASYHETDVNDVLRNLAIHYSFNYQKAGELVHLKFR